MKILVPVIDYEEFIANSLFCYNFMNWNGILDKPQFNNYENLFKFVVNSKNLISHDKLKKSLEFHVRGDYNKCYEVLIHTIGSNFSNSKTCLYEKIALSIYQLEFLEFIKNYYSLESFENLNKEDRNSIDIDSIFKICKDKFLIKRFKIEKFFNININYVFNKLEYLFDSQNDMYENNFYSLEKQKEINLIYKSLLEVLIENNYLKLINNKEINGIEPPDKLVAIFSNSLFIFLNSIQTDEEVLNFFKFNEFEFSLKPKNIKLVNKQNNKIFSNTRSNTRESNYTDLYCNEKVIYQLSYETESDYKNSEDGKLNEKLLSIEESLKTIYFDDPSINYNCSPKKDVSSAENKIIYPINNQQICVKSKSEDEYDYFLSKLKIFNLLKDYVKKKRKNREIKLRIKGKEKIANIFHSNLLKSRSFFGLLKWNKMTRYSQIVNQHYVEYRINYLSKLLMKSLIHVFNRKRLVEAFIELKNKRIIVTTYKSFQNIMKFKLNHKRLYLSQLLNNYICVKFLNKIWELICKLASKNKLEIISKSYLQNNIYKLKILNDLNNKRKIFGIILDNKKEHMEYLDKLAIVAERCKEILIKKSTKSFFKKENGIIKIKNNVKKFKNKLFMIRYYYFKFKRESVKEKLKVSMQQMEFKIIQNNFKKFIIMSLKKTKNVDKNQISYDHYTKKIKHNVINIWSNYSFLMRKVKYLKNKRSINDKIDFFRSLKINSIESLLIQGVKEKYKKYSKKNLLNYLIVCSTFEEKIIKAENFKKFYLKKNILNFLKKYKVVSNILFKNTIKFYLNIFQINSSFKKFTDEKLNSDQKKKIENAQKKICILRFKDKIEIKIKIRLIRNKKLLDIIKKTIKIFKRLRQKSLNSSIKLSSINPSLNFNSSNSTHFLNLIDERYKEFYFRSCLHKILQYTFQNKIKKTFLKKLYFKKFIFRTCKKISTGALKLCRDKMKKAKYLKYFLNMIYLNINKNYTEEALQKIKDKFILLNFFKNIQECSESIKLYMQIKTYYKIKQNRKIFRSFKYNYMNKIKQKMLYERYKEYLIFSSLRVLSEKLISNQK